ncbi:general substrate transporter [Aspergillus japonicus CBS 114.51]|uniref:General substrate transporter n=1 Tax=Aspergillus japonicus CBS 114.51 TaxID=1448312 RepID=A0A8T8WYX9_ASPJA|nr:general substrate transporter [Aspergillus japonicus CBS 114.51]RAH80529.1 general substrate transporter [Aspergillus japonicus CBS 114.51]
MGATGGGISKDALKQVPKPARAAFIWLVAIWASYCGSLHGFNSSNISGVMGMSAFKHEYGWDSLSSGTVTNYKGWVTSSMLLGQTAGILLSGPIMERRGRKPVILLAAIAYTIGALLMAVNFGSLAELMVGRTVSGLGSGIAYSAGPVYISEVAPTELRGMMSTFYNAGIMSGVAGAYWINYAVTMVIPAGSEWQWRIPMILQLIPSAILLVGYPFCPESPRFLMMRGQVAAARRNLIRLRGGLDERNAYFAREYTELRNKVDHSEDAPATGQSPWKSIQQSCRQFASDPTFRKVLVLVLFIQTFFIMSGGNSITYYAPTILASIGFNSSKVLLFTAVYGTIKFLSVFLYAFFLTERFGRRPLLLAGSAINLVCLIYIAAYLGKADLSATTSSPSAAAIIAVVALCVFAVGYGFGWAPAFSLTASEICPTSMRGTVITLAFTYQNLLNFGITRGFPNMTVAMHPWGPFALFAACTFCGTIWVFFAFPECKGRSMESTGALMALPWYKVGFEPVPVQQELQWAEETGGKDVEKDAYSEHEETVVERVNEGMTGR